MYQPSETELRERLTSFIEKQTGGPVTWPQYMGVISAAGAAPLITVNYGGF